MAYTFKDIPSNWRVPGNKTEFNLTAGNTGLIPTSDKIVFIAQKSSAGSATTNEPIEVFNLDDALVYFGAKSIAYCMCAASFASNPNKSVWVCPVIDNGTTKNVTTITFTATAQMPTSQYATFTVRLGSKSYSVTKNGLDKVVEETNGIGLMDLINSDNACPFVATHTNTSVTSQALVLTAKNAGTILNNSIKSTCSTITSVYPATSNDVTLSVAVVATTAGSAEPDFATALTACTAGRFTIYVQSSNLSANVSALKTHVETQANGLNEVGCIGVFGSNGTKIASADFITLCKTTINSWLMFGAFSNAAFDYGFEIAAAVAAQIARQPRAGDSINGYPLAGLSVVPIGSRETELVQQSYLENGILPVVAGNSGYMEILKARSTYCTSTSGGIIQKLMSLETPRSLFWLRTQVKNMESVKFTNRKNTAEMRDDLEDEVYNILKIAETPDYEITQNVDALRTGIVAETDTNNPARVNVMIPANIVPNADLICNMIILS